MRILVRNEYAIKFCQKLIDTKFKDKRLRRSLKKIFEDLDFYVLNKTSAMCVLSYVNQAPGCELNELAEYCKNNVSVN
jgi:23S rRNA-/tRNA-specific pseudouridylate synthase